MATKNKSAASVFNRNSPQARDMLAKTPAIDIGITENIPCTMAVKVSKAFFKEQISANGLHRPYLELQGSVTRMFIEEDEDRLFPCNVKNLILRDPEKVKVNYVLSTSELQNLVDMGLYYPDFEPPQNLIDNEIEIPGFITYTCIYDSPVSIVEIQNKDNIETSTKDNHYDNIFVEGCEISPQRAAEMLPDFQFSMANFSSEYLANKYTPVAPKNVYYDDSPSTPESRDILKPNMTEDQTTVNKFKDVLDENNKNIEQRANDEKNNANKRNSIVQKLIMKKRARDAAKAEADSFGFNTQQDDANNTDTSRFMYDEFKDLVKEVSDHSDDDTSGSETSRKVDVALDNQALNEGITDISGFGSLSDTSDESKMSAGEKRDYDAKKSRDALRRADIAADNQALNEGITDIAGQGAGTVDAEKKRKLEAEKKRYLSFLGGSDRAVPDTTPSTDSKQEQEDSSQFL